MHGRSSVRGALRGAEVEVALGSPGPGLGKTGALLLPGARGRLVGLPGASAPVDRRSQVEVVPHGGFDREGVASGRLGRLVVSSLLKAKYACRAFVRSAASAREALVELPAYVLLEPTTTRFGRRAAYSGFLVLSAVWLVALHGALAHEVAYHAAAEIGRAHV